MPANARREHERNLAIEATGSSPFLYIENGNLTGHFWPHFFKVNATKMHTFLGKGYNTFFALCQST